ncbi:hypothetical protein Nepgr_026862 [Nepenthes gracilis]|uniref:Uncharacterized protein n=1 Tax=Nepenthes gracilis TaxID=150966 RepID=A0AAD3Y2I3_NEPGR|nr:hypothetical protein Nepgr_026862 [Nepenthes gracilis]
MFKRSRTQFAPSSPVSRIIRDIVEIPDVQFPSDVPIPDVPTKFTGEVLDWTDDSAEDINAGNAQAEGEVSVAPTSVAEEAEVGAVVEPSSEVPAELSAAAVQVDQGEARDEETEGAQDLSVAEEEMAAPSIAVESSAITPHAGVPLSEAEVEVSVAPACEAQAPETVGRPL